MKFPLSFSPPFPLPLISSLYIPFSFLFISLLSSLSFSFLSLFSPHSSLLFHVYPYSLCTFSSKPFLLSFSFYFHYSFLFLSDLLFSLSQRPFPPNFQLLFLFLFSVSLLFSFPPFSPVPTFYCLLCLICPVSYFPHLPLSFLLF